MSVARTSASKGRKPTSPKKLSAEWPHFLQRLASVIEGLREDEYLIVSQKQSNLFVQFFCQGAYGMRVETTSNYYRAKKDQLLPGQVKSLTKLGWLLPTHQSDSSADCDPDGSSNFYIDCSLPVNFDEIADLAVRTFVDVMGVTHPGLLEYSARDEHGNLIPLPQLNIRMEVAPEPLKDLRRYLRSAVREATGLDFDYDKDGDLGGVAYGSATTFVSLCEDRPYVRLTSILLSDLDVTPELHTRINELNSQRGFMHMVVGRTSVVAMTETLASPFNTSHIVQTLSDFCQVADQLCDLLQTEFGEAAQPQVTH